MTSSNGAFDPHAPLVDQETGLEYEDFGDFLAGRPVDCARNRSILRIQWQAREGKLVCWQWTVFVRYNGYSREDFPYAAKEGWSPRLPQGIDHFRAFGPPHIHRPPDPSCPAGAGRAGALQAPADPVHAADQPAL